MRAGELVAARLEPPPRGDHAEALRCFEKAATLSGGRDFSALAEAAASQLALGRNDDALESARRALEVGPPPGPAETDERLEVTLRAGLALLALERHEEAGVVLDSILDEAPENGEAWAALGVAMAALGQEEAALSCQRQVLRIRARVRTAPPTPLASALASDLAVEVATLPPLPDGRALAIESALLVDAGTGGASAVAIGGGALHLAVVAPRRRPRRRRLGAWLRLSAPSGVRRRARRARVALTDGGPRGIAAARAGKRRRQRAAVRRRGRRGPSRSWGAPLGDLGDCDVVLASDVTYAADALPALASTLRARLPTAAADESVVAHERRVPARRRAGREVRWVRRGGGARRASASTTLHTESVGERRVLVLEVTLDS